MFFKLITIFAVTTAIFVLTVQTPDPWGESDGIAIPLTKRSDTDKGEFHVTSHIANISRMPSGMDGSERATGTPHLSAVQRDGFGAGLILANSQNGMWYGTIGIGTPPKPFTVQLNTGFSDLLVPALTGDQNCRSHRSLWDPASYQTTDTDFDMDFRITFTDGRTASGKQYMESVSIAGYTAEGQTIGVATSYSATLAAPVFAPDGVLGLGLPSMAQLRYQSPLLHTLFNEGKVSRHVFSLMLAEPGAELYIGGSNTALYIQSTLFFIPVTHPSFWQLMITEIRVNGQLVLENVPAVIDTGSNFICGDRQGVHNVHRAGGGLPYGGPAGYYTFPCQTIPTVTFIIGGRSIELHPNALNKGRTMRHSRYCFSGILDAHQDATLPWLLGTNFLQHLYTVFDFNNESPQIGFAQLARVV